jgi:3-oxoacyl-[acyl-carrier protein] reductase
MVTGGSRGIERAIYLRLGLEGTNVLVNYANGIEAAEGVVKILGGENAVSVKTDAGHVQESAKFVDATIQKFGKLE